MTQQESMFLELIHLFKGNPTHNFYPSKDKIRVLAQNRFSAVELKSLFPLLEQALVAFKLRYFLLFFSASVSNYELALADYDFSRRFYLLNSNEVFAKNKRSLGFQAMHTALAGICSEYEQSLTAAFESQCFAGMYDFLLFASIQLGRHAFIFTDLEFVEQVLVNICPVLNTVADLEETVQFDVSALQMKLPSILNFGYKFSLRLSLERKRRFDKVWAGCFLRQYSVLLLQYMKFGYCNDSFEFFAQQGDFDSKAHDFKLNRLNFVQVEAPGCVLYPKLFPYFVTEEIAREVVFIARVAKISRFQCKEVAGVQQLLGFLKQIDLSFENSLEFYMLIQTLKQNLSVYIYTNLLAPMNVENDIYMFIKIGFVQNSALFDGFLAAAKQYIAHPFRFTQETAYQQLSTRKSSFVESEINQIFNLEAGQSFNCFRLKNVGTESQIIADNVLASFYTKNDTFYYFDVDAYHFGVEKSQVLSGFGAYKQFGLLFDYMVYDFYQSSQPTTLLLSPQLKCSFSRVLRNLLYVRYFHGVFVDYAGDLSSLRRFYGYLDKFRRENPHFIRFNYQLSSVGAQISAVSGIFRLAHFMCLQINYLQMQFATRIMEHYDHFVGKKKTDFISLQAALIELAAGASAAVLLNEKPASLLVCQFFDSILAFGTLLADAKPFFAAYARYGKADERMALLIYRTDLCFKKVKEISDALTAILSLK